MSTTHISGLFVQQPNLADGVHAADVANKGILVVADDGLHLIDRRVMPVVPVVLGVLGGLVGLCAPTLLAFALSWVAFDIFTVRRGTTLVAVMTLLAGGAGFWGMLSAGEWLFSKDSRRVVASGDYALTQGATHVTCVWTEGERRVGAILFVPEQQRAQVAKALS